MRYLINKEISRHCRNNNIALDVHVYSDTDDKGRHLQTGTVVAHDRNKGVEYRVSNEVFIDCFYGNLSDEEFNRKYYR